MRALMRNPGLRRRAAEQGPWLLVALATGAAAFGIGYAVLGTDHPAGDAYILFRYAENLAAGHGIVFNAGGPPSEGATDFLFLLLLAAGVWLGADVAVVALGLNAVGAALTGGLLARVGWRMQASPAVRALLLGALAVATVVSGGALAAYSGFSSLIFSSLVLLSYAIAVEARGRGLLALPPLGLLVALFRPDGVIVGVAFVLLGLGLARSRRLVAAYLGAAGLCAGAGLVYFAWRWEYFGLLLPLPLYVKQHAGAAGPGGWSGLLPGLEYHARWLRDAKGPIPLLFGLGALLAALREWDEGTRRTLVFLLPVGLLLVELAFAVQSQNLHWRFQAPVWPVLLYALLRVGGSVLASRRSRASTALVAGLIVLAVLPASAYGTSVVRLVLDGGGRTYLEAFAPRFGPRTGPGEVFALTEAGILPYWTRSRVLDVVGLTSPQTALRPATVGDLEEAAPHLVFFHHAGTLRPGSLEGLDPDGDGIARLTPPELRGAVLRRHRHLLEEEIRRYEESGLTTVGYAPLVLARFLVESRDYEILAVDFKRKGRFLHVYGLRKDWRRRDAFRADLRAALQPEHYRSYLASKRQRLAGPEARRAP